MRFRLSLFLSLVRLLWLTWLRNGACWINRTMSNLSNLGVLFVICEEVLPMFDALVGHLVSDIVMLQDHELDIPSSAARSVL